MSHLKNSLSAEFTPIAELCMSLLEQWVTAPRGTVRVQLLQVTLETLSKFLSWINPEFVFNGQLVNILFEHFWEPIHFRIQCLQCLNEIACFELHETTSADGGGPANSQQNLMGNISNLQRYRQDLVRCYQFTCRCLTTLENNHLLELRANNESQQYWRQFVNQITLLLTNFLKHNWEAITADSDFASLEVALTYLCKVMEVGGANLLMQSDGGSWREVALTYLCKVMEVVGGVGTMRTILP